MNISPLRAGHSAIVVVSALLAGCSPGPQGATFSPGLSGQPNLARDSSHHQRWIDSAMVDTGWLSKEARTAGSHLIYVSAPTPRGGVIFIYTKSKPHRLVGRVTSGLNQSEGIALDIAGNFYVANISGANVTEYSPGSTTPTFTYTTDLVGPSDVAVVDGTLYVADAFGRQIVEYPIGSNKPSFIIPTNVYGISVSIRGAIYASVSEVSHQAVFRFPPRSRNGQDLGLEIGAGAFNGIVADPQGNIVADSSGADPPWLAFYQSGKKIPSKIIYRHAHGGEWNFGTLNNGNLYIAKDGPDWFDDLLEIRSLPGFNLEDEILDACPGTYGCYGVAVTQ